jgi:hypothetical protein
MARAASPWLSRQQEQRQPEAPQEQSPRRITSLTCSIP